jgi:hypothetical protein
MDDLYHLVLVPSVSRSSFKGFFREKLSRGLIFMDDENENLSSNSVEMLRFQF